MTLETTTRTFLFTDLEGSTRLWEAEPEGMRAALHRHNELVVSAVEEQGGSLVSNTGDGFVAIFPTADAALRTALATQLALRAERWPVSEPLKVRMGVHTDVVAMADGEFLSQPLNRCSRLMSAAHGGQIICSEATAVLARASLGDTPDLIDLGEHRLRDLAQPVHIFQLVDQGLERDFPPLRTLDAFPTNLPVELSTFIGREHQLKEIAAVVADARVVTLTGVGGVGKTRLALQVAADVIPIYRDGAWLVELAPIIDPDAIAEVVATTLGVTQRQGQSVTQSVLDFLRAKRLVLVMDNCEHLLDAAARFIDEIVRSCPHVLVLATSREGLGVVGERMIAVPSLELPPVERGEAGASISTEAVRLFAERANAAMSSFALTDDNRDAIVRLCRRLDGIPLAIELAAARVRSLTPAELADRLDARFSLLAGGPRTAVERHQTLQRAIDWSYNLLSENEQFALMRLSVFAGTFTIDAAEAVIVDDVLGPPAVVHLLGHLVDKSLVVAEHSSDVTRYRLLETIRQYAQERLEAAGSAATHRQLHAEHYASFAAEAGGRLRGPDEIRWTTRVEADLDNLRAALAWAQSIQDAGLAMRLIVPLALHGTRIGYVTGPWAEAVISLPDATRDPLFPPVQAWAGWALLISGDTENASRLVEEAVRSAEGERIDGSSACSVLRSATGVLSQAGHWEVVGGLAERWAEVARSIGDDYELAQALILVGMRSVFASDLKAALLHLDEALAISRRIGNPTAITYAAMTAGLVHTESEPNLALSLLDEALAHATSVGNNLGMGLTLSTSAYLHNIHGRVEDAAPYMLRCVEHFHRIGDRSFFAIQLHPAVSVMVRADAVETAAVIYGATPVGKGQYYEEEIVSAPWIGRFYQDLETLQIRLGEDRFVECAERGSRMDDDELVDLLREEVDHLLADPPP